MTAERRSRHRATLLAGIVAASALLLTACTGGADDTGSGVAGTVAPPEASAAAPADEGGADADADGADADSAGGGGAATWAPEPLPGNAVLATGTFDSPEGAVVGNIAIVTDAERNVEIVLSDFALDGAALGERTVQLTLLSEPIGEIGCYDTAGYSFQPAPPTGDAEQRMPMGPMDELPSGDPSFLDQAVVYAVADPSTLPAGCYGDTVAIADLEWLTPQDVPDTEDSGIRAGATGEAVSDEEGRLTSYVVEEGDTLSQIAERFGVSERAILYLNAGRIGQGGVLDDVEVAAGETLNLSPAAR
ncbi:LysM domain-containing protein [Herbiconiux sp. P15]|uniref:LysM peptidoglycan-binding domain-containing protein n=1 Tax=Herbiconiux liukaitaii TaxID=3342799 RepID=UPI0035B8C02A